MTWLSPWYFDAANAISELADAGQPFTVEDVEQKAGSPSHYNMLGRAMATAQAQGVVKMTGRYVKSAKPSRRKARIAQWIGAGAPVPVERDEAPRQGALL